MHAPWTELAAAADAQAQCLDASLPSMHEIRLFIPVLGGGSHPTFRVACVVVVSPIVPCTGRSFDRSKDMRFFRRRLSDFPDAARALMVVTFCFRPKAGVRHGEGDVVEHRRITVIELGRNLRTSAKPA